MSSSGLSQKNLLAPLLVSKQSVSPGPSMSLCCYLVYLNLPPALHFLSVLSFLLFISSISTSILCRSLRFCLSALFSFCLFLCHLCLLLSPLCQFHFSSHYSSAFVSTFFSIIQFIFSVSRSTFNYLSQLLSSLLLFRSLLPDATHDYSNLPVPLSIFLPLLSAVLPLIRGNMRSIPTTLRLTGVKGFGTGRS